MRRPIAIRHDSRANRYLHMAGWALLAAGVAATAKTGKKRYAAIGAAAGFGVGALGHVVYETATLPEVQHKAYRVWEELGFAR